MTNPWAGLLPEPAAPRSAVVALPMFKPGPLTRRLAAYLKANGPTLSVDLPDRLGVTAKQVTHAARQSPLVFVTGYAKVRRPSTRTLSSVSLKPGADTAKLYGPRTAGPIRDLLLIDGAVTLDELYRRMGMQEGTIRNAIYCNTPVFKVTRLKGVTGPTTTVCSVYAHVDDKLKKVEP